MRSGISGLLSEPIAAGASSMGGMGVGQLKELKRLQKENDRPRRGILGLTFDKLILKQAARGSF